MFAQALSNNSRESPPAEMDIKALAAEMRKHIVIKDHKQFFGLTVTEKSFIATEAMRWLIENKKADDDVAAVSIGNMMLEEGLIVAANKRDRSFRTEGRALYRFREDDASSALISQQEQAPRTNDTAAGAEEAGTAAADSEGTSMWGAYAARHYTRGADSVSSTNDGSLLPTLPWEDKEELRGEELEAVAEQLPPIDEHNIKLLNNVHPTPWIDPEPRLMYNLLVLGSGAGGLVSSIGSVGFGAKVALVEANLFGGDCTNFGCVPSKALIKSATVAHTIRHCEEYGIELEADDDVGERERGKNEKDFKEGETETETVTAGAGMNPKKVAVRVNFRKVMERMRRIRAEISDFDAAARLRSLGIDVFVGKGVFDSPSSLVVNGKRLCFRKCIICTGGKAYVPTASVKGLASVPYLTNESLFNLTELPRRLVILGGGPIGVEMAQVFQRFGSQVTVLARGPKILDREDEDAALVVQEQIVRDGVAIHTNTSINEVSMNADGSIRVSVRIAGSGAAGSGSAAAANTQDLVIEADKILVATGRRPTVKGYGLEAAKVAYSEGRGIEVNDNMRTSNPIIYAAGDCCSSFQFTHAADWMARLAIKNALFFGAAKFSGLIMPWCTFTEPEIAHVGLYPRDLEQRKISFDTYRKSFAEMDRAVCESSTLGFVKMHVKAGGDTILGCTIVGEGAGDMISEVTTLMHANIGLNKLGAVIHPYPTRADAIRQLGDQYFEQSVSSLTRSVLRSLLGWGLRG